MICIHLSRILSSLLLSLLLFLKYHLNARRRLPSKINSGPKSWHSIAFTDPNRILTDEAKSSKKLLKSTIRRIWLSRTATFVDSFRNTVMGTLKLLPPKSIIGWISVFFHQSHWPILLWLIHASLPMDPSPRFLIFATLDDWRLFFGDFLCRWQSYWTSWYQSFLLFLIVVYCTNLNLVPMTNCYHSRRWASRREVWRRRG